MHRQASEYGVAMASVPYLLQCGCKMPRHRYSRRTGAQVVTELGKCMPLLLALVLLEDVEGVRTQGGSKMVASLSRSMRLVETCLSLRRKRVRDAGIQNLKISD